MTSYGAYDAGLPCKNPSCKSHGRPHPNCRCYGDMADGGEVEQFCSEDRAHQSGCEYFAEGGDVSFDSMVDDSTQTPDTQNFDEMKEDKPANPVQDFDSIQDDSDKYSTPAQKLGAAAEGVAQGVAGPLATWSEKHILGIPEEDIAGRQKANPLIHGTAETAGLAGSMFIPLGGQLGVAAKAADAFAHYLELGKVGSAIVKGAISNGMIKGFDETSDYIMGKDPDKAFASRLIDSGASALFGGALGAGTSGAAKGLQSLAESKLGGKISGVLAGIASAAQEPLESARIDLGGSHIKELAEKGLLPHGMKYEDYKLGQKIFDLGLKNPTKGAGPAIGGYIGGKFGHAETGMYAGYQYADKIGKQLEKWITHPLSKKYIAPVVFKIMSNGNASGLSEVLDMTNGMSKGTKALGLGIDSLFKAGSVKTSNEVSQKLLDKFDDYIKNGGYDQNVQQQIYDQNKTDQIDQYAKGGPIVKNNVTSQPDGIETHYPEQNMLLNMARGRVSNYLKSIRPPEESQKLPFDDNPDTSQQKKNYMKALAISIKPLSVLDEVGKGTIEASHIKHLSSMYPEVVNLLQEKITKRIIKDQLDNKKPSSKIRQGLSMLMRSPLSGEYTPQNIQAAQSVFIMKGNQQKSQPSGGNGSASKLTKSDQSYLTGGQALQRRSQKI